MIEVLWPLMLFHFFVFLAYAILQGVVLRNLPWSGDILVYGTLLVLLYVKISFEGQLVGAPLLHIYWPSHPAFLSEEGGKEERVDTVADARPGREERLLPRARPAVGRPGRHSETAEKEPAQEIGLLLAEKTSTLNFQQFLLGAMKSRNPFSLHCCSVSLLYDSVRKVPRKSSPFSIWTVLSSREQRGDESDPAEVASLP